MTMSSCNQSLSLEKLRLLVVDDDPDTREILTTLFEVEGVEIVAVASADEAWVKLQHFQPNLLISDIHMPGEDGYSLLRRLRSQKLDPLSQIPAIALTGSVRDVDREYALAAGFQKHLSKPIDLDELSAIVASFAQQPDFNGRITAPQSAEMQKSAEMESKFYL